MILTLTVLWVLVIDQTLKFLLRGTERFESVRLGPYGNLQIVTGRLWVHRISVCCPNALWLWILSAGALLAGSAWIPLSHIFVGLLLGGSLSNAMEGCMRGSVTDYVCLRFWPAFNLADVALTAGAIGVVVELLKTVGGSAV